MKWAVEIQKTNLERRNLEDLLNGLGFTLIDGINFPAFTSPGINECDTAANVFEKAKQLRAAFTGPAQIDPTFSIGCVIDFSFTPPTGVVFVEPQSGIMNISGQIVTLILLPPKGLSAEELELWEKGQAVQKYQAKLEGQRAKLEPAFRNSKAAKVLELLSIENPSGETIYKIYELAEGHWPNREAFHRQFGVTNDQFKRLKDAVHNYKVTGDFARHACERGLNSDNPMSKDEAIQFVRQLATRWLEYVRVNSA